MHRVAKVGKATAPVDWPDFDDSSSTLAAKAELAAAESLFLVGRRFYKKHSVSVRAHGLAANEIPTILISFPGLPGWHFQGLIPEIWPFLKWFGMKKWCLACTS